MRSTNNFLKKRKERKSRPVASWLVCLLILFLTAVPAMAQQTSLVQRLKNYRSKALQEKLFLHLDRPLYIAGETMWFRVYNVDGTLHRPLDMSKVAYVEVLDEKQQPVLQGKIAMKEGLGQGSFVLPLTLQAGNFTVRAYTSWMKNFTPDFYFAQQVTILNTYLKPRLKPENESAYAMQFFPEGGNLVNGLPIKVAYKITEKNTGIGAAATGKLQDGEGNVITTIAPGKAGIGHFTFTPDMNADYTATLTVDGEQVLTQRLPRVYAHGYVMQLHDDGKSDLKISVRAAPAGAEAVHLLGHTRMMVSTVSSGRLLDGKAEFLVNRDSLADGITHFTLFNSSNQPVCERLYFKKPTRKLAIEATVEKNMFSRREQVELQLSALAGTAKAANANLSVSVYRLDETQSSEVPDITSYLWLNSELKGQVENAASYLEDRTPAGAAALDNLMLTHGWSRFKWEDLEETKTPAYAFLPEYDGHLVQGRVTDAQTGAAAPGVYAYMASPSRHIRLYNAECGANGAIRFEAKDFFGQRELVVQTDSRTDSTYLLEIFSPFSMRFSSIALPPLHLEENWREALTMRHTEAEAQQLFFQRHRDKYAAAGVDSLAFYGTPDYRYFLDDYTRFKVMEEVMREYVPAVLVRRRGGGFHFKVLNKDKKEIFQNDPMVLLDGVPVFDIDKLMAFDPLKIQRLDVIANAYFQGAQQYEGVVSYTTYKGDLAGFTLNPHALLQEYEGLQLHREFYAPAYTTEEQQQSRLPDFRNLLHWAPDIKTNAAGNATVSFFTSDSPGTYRVVVQGLTKNGLFGSNTLTFEVKQPL